MTCHNDTTSGRVTSENSRDVLTPISRSSSSLPVSNLAQNVLTTSSSSSSSSCFIEPQPIADEFSLNTGEPGLVVQAQLNDQVDIHPMPGFQRFSQEEKMKALKDLTGYSDDRLCDVANNCTLLAHLAESRLDVLFNNLGTSSSKFKKGMAICKPFNELRAETLFLFGVMSGVFDQGSTWITPIGQSLSSDLEKAREELITSVERNTKYTQKIELLGQKKCTNETTAILHFFNALNGVIKREIHLLFRPLSSKFALKNAFNSILNRTELFEKKFIFVKKQNDAVFTKFGSLKNLLILAEKQKNTFVNAIKSKLSIASTEAAAEASTKNLLDLLAIFREKSAVYAVDNPLDELTNLYYSIFKRADTFHFSHLIVLKRSICQEGSLYAYHELIKSELINTADIRSLTEETIETIQKIRETSLDEVCRIYEKLRTCKEIQEFPLLKLEEIYNFILNSNNEAKKKGLLKSDNELSFEDVNKLLENIRNATNINDVSLFELNVLDNWCQSDYLSDLLSDESKQYLSLFQNFILITKFLFFSKFITRNSPQEICKLLQHRLTQCTQPNSSNVQWALCLRDLSMEVGGKFAYNCQGLLEQLRFFQKHKLNNWQNRTPQKNKIAKHDIPSAIHSDGCEIQNDQVLPQLNEQLARESTLPIIRKFAERLLDVFEMYTETSHIINLRVNALTSNLQNGLNSQSSNGDVRELDIEDQAFISFSNNTLASQEETDPAITDAEIICTMIDKENEINDCFLIDQKITEKRIENDENLISPECLEHIEKRRELQALANVIPLKQTENSIVEEVHPLDSIRTSIKKLNKDFSEISGSDGSDRKKTFRSNLKNMKHFIRRLEETMPAQAFELDRIFGETDVLRQLLEASLQLVLLKKPLPQPSDESIVGKIFKAGHNLHNYANLIFQSSSNQSQQNIIRRYQELISTFSHANACVNYPYAVQNQSQATKRLTNYLFHVQEESLKKTVDEENRQRLLNIHNNRVSMALSFTSELLQTVSNDDYMTGLDIQNRIHESSEELTPFVPVHNDTIIVDSIGDTPDLSISSNDLEPVFSVIESREQAIDVLNNALKWLQIKSFHPVLGWRDNEWRRVQRNSAFNNVRTYLCRLREKFDRGLNTQPYHTSMEEMKLMRRAIKELQIGLLFNDDYIGRERHIISEMHLRNENDPRLLNRILRKYSPLAKTLPDLSAEQYRWMSEANQWLCYPTPQFSQHPNLYADRILDVVNTVKKLSQIKRELIRQNVDIDFTYKSKKFGWISHEKLNEETSTYREEVEKTFVFSGLSALRELIKNGMST